MIEKQSIKIKGGKREGAGRKKNTPNKRTAEIQKMVEQSGMTPLEFMLNVMRNESEEPKERLAAAVAAAPYVHARLSSITVGGDPDKPLITKTVREIVDPANKDA